MKLKLINCQSINFNQTLSSNRLEAASRRFGEKLVKRIIAFSLFLLGANRQDIADKLQLSVNTIKSNIKALHSDGIAAFEDRRQKKSTFLPKDKQPASSISWSTEEENFILTIGSEVKIQIPQKNKLQLRTVALTMLNNGLLKTSQTAEILQLSVVQTNKLARKLQSGDIDSLIDQRKGQTQDYVFTPEIKAQLIQQYAFACVCHQKISGKALAKQLKQSCQVDLPERTIRHHVAKLGLVKIKNSLPRMIDEFKKNFKPTQKHGP